LNIEVHDLLCINYGLIIPKGKLPNLSFVPFCPTLRVTHKSQCTFNPSPLSLFPPRFNHNFLPLNILLLNPRTACLLSFIIIPLCTVIRLIVCDHTVIISSKPLHDTSQPHYFSKPIPKKVLLSLTQRDSEGERRRSLKKMASEAISKAFPLSTNIPSQDHINPPPAKKKRSLPGTPGKYTHISMYYMYILSHDIYRSSL
jgi:hypothetical protein